MAENRYFVCDIKTGSYNKISNDGSSMYRFKPGTPVLVRDREDQMKFAGDTNFIETDKSGKPLKKGKMPSNDKSPLSYIKVGGDSKKSGSSEKPAPSPAKTSSDETGETVTSGDVVPDDDEVVSEDGNGWELENGEFQCKVCAANGELFTAKSKQGLSMHYNAKHESE